MLVNVESEEKSIICTDLYVNIQKGSKTLTNCLMGGNFKL
jgi:hypothetical protein